MSFIFNHNCYGRVANFGFDSSNIAVNKGIHKPTFRGVGWTPMKKKWTLWVCILLIKISYTYIFKNKKNQKSFKNLEKKTC